MNVATAGTDVSGSKVQKQTGDGLQPSLNRLSQGAILAACFLGVATGYSSTYFYTSGLFILPISQEFGLSRGQASLGPLACTLGAAAVIPLFGRLVDRAGAMTIGVLSLIGLAVSFMAMALLNNGFASYIACSLLIALLGAGSTALPFSRLVIGAFKQRRGLALGFMFTGTGVGAMTLPLLVLPMIRSDGWRVAYESLAGAVTVAAIIVALLLLPFRKTFHVGQRRGAIASSAPQSVSSIWSSRSFILIGTLLFMIAMCLISVVVHFVPMLSGVGAAPGQAAKGASTIGIASIAGRLLIGYLLDRYRPETLALWLIGVAACGVCLLVADSLALLLPAALLIGLAVGAELDLATFLAARYFPAASYGTAYGGLFSLFLIGGAIGPAATGFFYDFAGGYRAAFLANLIWLVVAVGAALALRAQGRDAPVQVSAGVM